MPLDRKRLLGYVETIKLISGATDNFRYMLKKGNTNIALDAFI